MSRQRKRWIIYPEAPASQLARLSHVDPLLVQVLWNRGIHDPAAVEAFLAGETRLDDPFRIKGMNEAVTRIRRAIRQGERMVVYGDFDADGVTATALLVQALSALGGFVRPYIPHRVDEGYGLNNNALAELEREGQQLVITVDCGIRSVDEVAFANRLGLDVIVTDHHSIGPELPPALAAINPKRPDCPYPFKGLAGVGLAYKLAQALLRSHRQAPIRNGLAVDLQEAELLDLVALGTVADLAPLLEENRTLVQRGLAQLNRTQRAGLQAMMGGGRHAARQDHLDLHRLQPGAAAQRGRPAGQRHAQLRAAGDQRCVRGRQAGQAIERAQRAPPADHSRGFRAGLGAGGGRRR
jgi:single-stranded-DNA-specific exonuclease